jgi:hypothetical protein
MMGMRLCRSNFRSRWMTSGACEAGGGQAGDSLAKNPFAFAGRAGNSQVAQACVKGMALREVLN